MTNDHLGSLHGSHEKGQPSRGCVCTDGIHLIYVYFLLCFVLNVQHICFGGFRTRQ